MRKLIAIFLLTIFAFSSNYTWVVEMVNHHQMKAKVATLRRSGQQDDLEQFVFSDKEFRQLEFEDEGHEMEFKGNMYDIVSIKQLPGKKIVYCLSDKKEAHLKKLAKQQQQQKDLRSKNALTKIYIPSADAVPNAGRAIVPQQFFLFVSTGSICRLAYDILKPPPEIAA